MKHYLTAYNPDRSLFDAFDSLFKPMFVDEQRDMRTDIKETETGYELDIEMPGFQKDQISVSLEDGYLNVSGTKKTKEEAENQGKKYLRKEISESFQRSYYVGTDISEENVKAKYDNGILSLSIPKPQPKTPQLRSINID